MDLDAEVCYCFHITRRKLVNFVRTEKPRVASQLSECGGAGTGCGWCVPFLKQLFEKSTNLDPVDPEEYARRRQAYLAAGKVRAEDRDAPGAESPTRPVP